MSLGIGNDFQTPRYVCLTVSALKISLYVFDNSYWLNILDFMLTVWSLSQIIKKWKSKSCKWKLKQFTFVFEKVDKKTKYYMNISSLNMSIFLYITIIRLYTNVGVELWLYLALKFKWQFEYNVLDI